VDSSLWPAWGVPVRKGSLGERGHRGRGVPAPGLGIETGVSLEAVLETSEFISKHLRRKPNSRVAIALRKPPLDSESKL